MKNQEEINSQLSKLNVRVWIKESAIGETFKLVDATEKEAVNIVSSIRWGIKNGMEWDRENRNCPVNWEVTN
jgi:hypothetical protein